MINKGFMEEKNNLLCSIIDMLNWDKPATIIKIEYPILLL